MASVRRKSCSPYYFACFRGADGRRHQQSTKEKSRNRALKIAVELESAARTRDSRLALQQKFNQISQDLYSQPLPSDTVREYLHRVLRERAGEIAKSSSRRYTQVVEDFCSHLGPNADKPIRDIVLAEILDFRKAIMERTTPANANATMKALRSFFSRALQDRIISENPTLRLKPLREESRDPSEKRRPFTLDEIERLKTASVSFGPEWVFMIELGSLTGQRLADVANMNWCDISRVDNRLAVWSFTSRKTKRKMALPLPLGFIDRMANALQTGNVSTPGQVFPSAAALHAVTGTSNALSNQFWEILVKTGLCAPRDHKRARSGRRSARRPSTLGYHSFRHTVTSRLSAGGIPRSVIMDYVGHDSPAMSFKYTHAEMLEKERALDLLNGTTG